MALVLAGALLACAPQTAHAVPSWTAYHDNTQANHLAQVTALQNQGYRPISLSTYGAADNPLYAAVWVKRSGPPWREFHGLTYSQLVAYIDSEALKGMNLSLLTCSTNDLNTARFAGTTEQNGALTNDFNVANDKFYDRLVEFKKKGYLLKSAVALTNKGVPCYFTIYEKNLKNVLWNVGCNLTPEADQQWFDAMQTQWARPSFSTRTSAGRYLSIYRDDSVGPCAASGELTAAGYQQEVAKQKANGLFPICVQGAGEGAATRFTAIFASDDVPVERAITVTGPASGALSTFDDAVTTRMKASGTHSGTLAIAYKGKLVYARGFTWAEPSYPVTQPTSLFRLASCTKPLTSIGIHQLIEEGSLSLDDGVQSILNTPLSKVGKMDSRYKDIKVWELLSHAGGRLHGPDVPQDYLVKDELGKTLPVSKYDVTSYMAGKPLDFTPGSVPWSPNGKDYYSNLGYNLLGQIIEKKRGVSYEQAMKDHLWNPLGVTRPRIANPLAPAPGEVRYHDVDSNGVDLRVVNSVMHSDEHLVPLTYGGENLRNADSFGAWVLSAPDYVKVLAAFDLADNPLFKDDKTIETMWSPPDAYASTNPNLLRGWFLTWRKNGKVLEYTHGGALPSVSTVIAHRTDGISYAAFFNGNIGNIQGPIDALCDGMAENKWPTTDLFPQVGLSTFLDFRPKLNPIFKLPPNIGTLVQPDPFPSASSAPKVPLLRGVTPRIPPRIPPVLNNTPFIRR